MNSNAEKLIVTDINRIVFVDENEYDSDKLVFSSPLLRYHELIFHFSGDNVVYFNDKILFEGENYVRFLPKGECNKYVVERRKRGACIDICFSSNLPLFPEAVSFKVKNENIGALFRKIFLLWVQKDEQFFPECLSVLYKIIAEIQRVNYLPSSKNDKLAPAISYIHENFLSAEIISSEKLSSLCGISYAYIKKLFAQRFKLSPKKYIVSLKMNYACDLLRHGGISISKTAESCGYGDVYAFSHQFKTTVGLSPTEFAKKYKSSK